ncbi:Tll0287-like domain-containing protein [Nitrospina watsonii]|uniref:Tll0287-like domain-containing protein n=1 Tax=Nitrospina watsonii TaxID=1323948 RepID=UPI00249313DA|nr:DUF3365 domain-containing protein [Nitrospina watsonii]
MIIPLPESSAEFSESSVGISPDKAAHYIHAVIKANRTIYSQYLVDRLNEAVGLNATENWEQDKTLPLPVQFLLMSAEQVRSQEVGLDYKLMSLWPINENNGPATEIERDGLLSVMGNPDEPFNWIVKEGKRVLFNAIYSDRAVAKRCVSCHNAHAKSPNKNFKVGDVMGGILVQFPVARVAGPDDAEARYQVLPEVLADYIHAILEADRTIYTKHVVQRLETEKVSYASENWWENNCLLLPAQFLLNASDLVQSLRLGFDYRLISLWPVNPHNGAANEFERYGLESVAESPRKPYSGTTWVGRRPYFQAVYPDQAIASTCVSCHNAHPRSPKHNFKLNEVMGGIVVSIPLGQEVDLLALPGLDKNSDD